MNLIVLYFAICYFITAHLTTPIGVAALLAGAVYLFVKPLQIKWPVVLFGVVYSLLIAFNFERLQQELRLLLNEWIEAFNKFGLVLPLQATAATSATVSISLVLLLLAVCLTKKTWPFVLVITLCIPFLLQAPLDLFAVFVLFASALFVQMTKKTFQLLYFVPLTLLLFATFPFEHMPFLHQAGQHVENVKNKLQYDANNEAQLTNGDFSAIRAVSQSEEPAFRIAMETPRAVYLKTFVGAHFENGWLPNSLHAPKNIDITAYLKEQQHFEATQFAQASAEGKQTVSIEHIQLSKAVALTPYELATPIEGFNFKQNRWQSTSPLGQGRYTYAISETAYYEYPQVAEKLYTTPAPAYLKTEAIANYVNYDAYTAISDEERVLLANHFGPAAHTSYEETIQAVQASMSTLSYDETVGTLKGDFLQVLLEESKSGHTVHYATLATLLFRYHGVPARYVEGYIITNEDIKNAAGANELTIPFKNQHAWPEIYIDQIGWVPIEVTPGYIEKMPETVQSSFKQSTAPVAPSVQQKTNETNVKDEFIPEEPPVETKNTEPNWPWKIILIGLLLCFVSIMLYVAVRLNKVELAFKRFIRKTRTKENADLPLHRHIESLNNEHAQAAYQLYNEIKYLHEGRYTKAQLKELRLYLKRAKK